MWKNRLLYLFALGCIFVFYLVYSLWFSRYLLILALAFPLFDLIISIPGITARRASVSAPSLLNQGEPGKLIIETVSKSPFPAGLIKTRLRVSYDGKTEKRRIMCGSEPGSRLEMPIDTTQSGVTFFSLSLLWVTSLMGLFSVPVTVSGGGMTLVLPPPQRPPNAVSLTQSEALKPKPGGGFAEEHGIRPFRTGDPVRGVHWKLSAKLGELITREPLEPAPQRRLVRCDLWNTSRERDLILGRLRWIAEYLLERGQAFHVRLGEVGEIAEVEIFEDLTFYLLRAADRRAAPQAKESPLGTPFTWVFQVDGREEAP